MWATHSTVYAIMSEHTWMTRIPQLEPTFCHPRHHRSIFITAVMPAMQATIDSWRLGWNFTAKETIQSASNVYTSSVQTIALDAPNVQLQGSGVNNTVKPFSWTEISFLGTKSTEPIPNAQYKASLYT